MSYTSLALRLNDLPQVIAGPILRRTEKTRVAVWIAMRTDPGALRLKVYLGNNVVAASPSTPLMRFGTNLYIIVLTASTQANQPLTAGNIYEYDIFFNDTSTSFTGNGSTTQLASAGILDAQGTGIYAITYLNSGRSRPSFSLPPDALEDVRLVHTSCRKPHGGHYDALPAVNTMIETQVNSANGRPHQLFFTGDQIYADDVSAAILAIITDIKNTFIGNWSEFGTRPDNTYLFTEPSVTDSRIGNRFPYVNNLKLSAGIGTAAGINPKEADNHLLSLGEFMAMYLLNWSDVLWPIERDDLPEFDSIFTPLGKSSTKEKWVSSDPINADASPTDLPNIIISVEKSEEFIEYNKDTDGIWMFHQGLVEVRRALANVPVYMMWDDHDVTDDWFFTYNWTKNVLGITNQSGQTNNPYGRLVVQNGMTAFNIFQGWGNAPERYESFTAGGFLLTAVRKVFSGATEWQNAQNWLDIAELVLPAWNTGTTFKGVLGTEISSPIEYDLTLQFGKYVILMLDTRSNRFFQNTSDTDATFGRERPILIRENRLTEVLSEATALYEDPARDNQVLLVVSPAPVIGHNIIDLQINEFRELFNKNAILHKDKLFPLRRPDEVALGQYSPGVLRDKLDLWFDSEAWSGNPLGQQAILSELAKFGRVVVLSGDVHFSYSCLVNYWRSSLRTGVIAQLTSSASKNSTPMPGEYVIEGPSNTPIIEQALIAPRTYVGWNSTTTSNGQPHLVLKADLKPIIVQIPNLVPIPTPVVHPYPVLGNPALLCTNPLIASTFFLNRLDPPDWSYKYYFCEDSDDSRLALSRNDYNDPINPTLSHWQRLAVEHTILHHVVKKPVVVNNDNIAEVTFKWLDQDKLNLAVGQGFWYGIIAKDSEPSPDTPIVLKPYTLHTLDMSQPDAYTRPETYYN